MISPGSGASAGRLRSVPLAVQRRDRMPAERTIMRQVREVLRLKFVGGVPIREIARRVGVAASVMVTRRKKRKSLSTPHSGRSAPRRMKKARSTDVKKRAVALLTRELDEARQQQAATADVLKIIRHSASDL